MKEPLRLWFGLGWVALVLIGVFAGVQPKLKGIDRLEAEGASLTDRAERADNGAAELARLRNRLSEVRAIAETQIKKIPSESDVAGLIRELTSVLDQLGMSEREITTGSAEDFDDAMSAPMTVRMKGPFLGVQASIAWLESLPRLVRVLRLKIETPRRSAQDRLSSREVQVEAELLLNVFFDTRAKRSPELVADAVEAEQ